MKRHWFLFALVALGLVLMAGCESAKPKVAEPTPGKLAVNTSVLPTPRPQLAASPDLSGATLVINDATLAKMSADAVPSSVTDALASLKGKEFTNAAEFSDAVRGAVGSGADPYMDRILRNALVVTLADEVAAPQGEMSIAEREGAMAKQPMAAPSPYGIVYFDFDKYNIKPEFQQTIDENAKALMAHPDVKVQVEGHCDERGTNEYNLALGQRRAEAVRQALIAAGVSASQLSTISYGEERPVDPGHNEAAWAKNRRSVLTVSN
ncbi:MAG TPA: peptidoglycan-associated lipoprotein Pal [bacterium]|nr:peptidoglycan-associated lipoprotein Pal [bacterium]